MDVTHRNYEGMIHGFVNMLEEPAKLDRAHETIETIGEDLRASFE